MDDKPWTTLRYPLVTSIPVSTYRIIDYGPKEDSI